MAKEQDQQKEQPSEAEKTGMPPLPKAFQKRVSMKWLTVNALSKVLTRLRVEGTQAKVLFLTPFGQVEGRLNEIRASYAESFSEAQQGEGLVPDLASMVTNVRSDLLRTLEEQEKGLQVADVAPILSLTDVVIVDASGSRSLQQLTLFADQVIGFTLVEIPHVHEGKVQSDHG